MAGSVGGDVKAEPNLTPLLDVVFQLITFFMLVINFSQENYNQKIRLPVAGSARPVEPSKVAEDRLILNIDRDGQMLFGPNKLTSEQAVNQIKLEAELFLLNAKQAKLEVDKDNLPTKVVIRADRDTQFNLIFRLISACQANGFRNFELKAMSKAEVR